MWRSARTMLCLLGMLNAASATAQFSAPTPRPGRVRGIVFDSLLNAPLVGATATIVLPAGNRSATTDSTGRFVIDGVPPGTYLVGVHAAVLDSLDIADRTTTVQVFSATTALVQLATPSMASLHDLYCPDTVTNRAPTVAFGRVRTLVAGRRVVVNVDWREPRRPDQPGSPALHVVQRDESQLWSACGVPPGAWLYVTARDSGVISRALFALGDRGAIAVDLNVRPGTRRMTGRVIDETGRPVADARVGIVGTNQATMSGALGTFVLDSAPAATFTLDVRQAGYRPRLVVLSGDGDPPPITLARQAPDDAGFIGSDHLRFALREGIAGGVRAEASASAPLLERLVREHEATTIDWWVDGLPADPAFALAHRGARLRAVEYHVDGATAPVEWRRPGRVVALLWTAGADW